MALALLRVLVAAAVAGTVAAQSPAYGQCGGIGWSGSTTCVSGSSCVKQNDYYSQCIPGAAAPTSPTTSASPTTPTSSSPPATTTSATGGSSPSTPATGSMSAEWQAAYTKAKAAVAKLSLSQKVDLATGIQWEKGPCVGNTPAISTIGYPALCLQDSPAGVRYADKVTVFPPGINVAATFNRTLMRQRGAALGQEFRGKGVHVGLGPAVNLARAPAGGRNWESFGADPFLAGEAAYETVTGMQSSGVQACVKHYINNEQENKRETSSSNVDDRTQHELYLHPFLRAVQANVASVMCSYNQVNGTYLCENDKLLNGLLKTELGFPGYVMSDWWATHSTNSINAGLDMTMPGDTSINSGQTYFGQNLISAVNSGTVAQTRINDMATRVLAAWYLLKQDSGYPATNFNSWSSGSGSHVDVQGTHGSLVRQIGSASIVLLKNNNAALPLKTPKTIAVIGNPSTDGSKGINGYTDRGGLDGVLAIGWGSGTADFPYLIAPLTAIKSKASGIGATVTSSTSDSDLNGAASAAAGKDVALVFIAADSGEGYITVEGNAGDRKDLEAWHGGNALVQRVASANKNTVVVIETVGAIDMEAWVSHPNVTGIVLAGVLGQEAGNSIADVLFGAVNPSGRLPYTIGKSINDYSAKVDYSQSGGILQVPYSEGLLVDYKSFDQAGVTPRFEFGFGLSYTTFDYSGLSVTGSVGSYTPPSGPGSSINSELHKAVFTASFTLKNNGTVAGNEIPQLYISPPASAKSPPYLLKGFDNVYLEPGQSTTVSISLTRYDLSIWNVATQRWEIPTGSHKVTVGASSRDRRLTGTITV